MSLDPTSFGCEKKIKKKIEKEGRARESEKHKE